MVTALNRYHRKHPPVHVLLALYIDYRPPPDIAIDAPADPAAVFAQAKNLRDELPAHLRAAADRFLELEVPA